MEDQEDKRHRLRLDWTLNITTLGSIVLALATGIITVTQIQAQNDKRLALLEMSAQAQRQVDTSQDSRTQQELTLIRQSLQRIEDRQEAAVLRGAGK